MKRMVLFLALALVPVMAFAQFQIGAVGMYDSSIENLNAGAFTADDFTYGFESRLGLGIFQGGFTFLYLPDVDPTYDQALMMADLGLTLKVLFLRFGLGVGPNYVTYLDTSVNPAGDSIPVGVNLKASADIEFGDISLGLVGFYYFSTFDEILNADYSQAIPYFGVSLLFKLF